jgi:RNA polymerase sigma-70 factor (ECF subfamily)
MARLDRPLARCRIDSASIDDVKSHLREALLLGLDGAPPKLLDYRGQGDLLGWLQVSAIRLAIQVSKRQKRHQPIEDGTALFDAVLEAAELHVVKAELTSEFRAALHEAWEALDSRERNLLRQHYLNRFTTEEVATTYRVNRAAAVRWIAAARNALLSSTRRRLTAALRLQPGEFESAMRQLDSGFDLTLAGESSLGRVSPQR